MAVEFRYPCVRVRQAAGAKDLLLFSAPALDIEQWVGIPQRLSLEGSETAGFQRTVSPSREAALRKFFVEPKNVIQNPLLCAVRQTPGVQIRYLPSLEDEDLGHVEFEFTAFAEMTYLQLLTAARLYLEQRDPSLVGRLSPKDLVASLQSQLDPDDLISGEDDPLSPSELEAEFEDAEDFEDEDAGADGAPAEEALFDESQITDFWDQLRAREEVAAKLPPQRVVENLAGFSRGMLESYLRPAILVDGQHRLKGALLAARDIVETGEDAKAMILAGKSPEEALNTLMPKVARRLPISLLMDDSAAEHVFQYVLVNQKATPVPKALLGTIISTSLAEDELAMIADRLEDAKIQLQGSRIISILSRSADSPFAERVAKGLDGDGAGKLPWSVLGSLADIFRYLQGGRLYHDPTDHAKIWRRHHLDDSKIVSDWQTKGFKSSMEYWQDINGPWMGVFKAFWSCTRDALANTDNPDAYNYWGNSRTSNVYNKPSLHILEADFFRFLKEGKKKIDDVDQIQGLVADWLEYSNKQYFAKNWELEGVKKDSVGTRRQWSKLWANHRENGGSIPAPADFRKISKA